MEKHLGFKLYPHKFRHTFCSRLLKRGVPLTTVIKLAGHAHIQTTFQITIRNPYVCPSFNILECALNRLSNHNSERE
ncbi:tyrosine-type recombinase/integrase [Brevibacillus choshinensis]|uniref:tyrosine-type recombinase/integrase n=1 Tax=Brevibacillus choshinensis TaxID=54911 RepID=UPI001F29A8BA|nr:site-specific integrase [Brevibacillus choshinensis]